MHQVSRWPTAALRLCLAASAALLAACAGSYSPGPLAAGATRDAVTQRMGQPTGQYARPGGGVRMEYGGGPLGKHTYMLDLDAQGRLVSWEQVLDEAHFNTIHASMTRDEVLMALGHPARVWGVRYHDQTVWSFRFDDIFCRLFHVGLTPEGIVEDTSYGPDELCERKNRIY